MRRTHRFVWLVLCVAILLVWRSTAPPGITWQHGGADGAELAVAVQRLGVAHPPGYGLYVLLGHAFTHLPLGPDLAARLTWFSHAAALLACLALATTVRRVCGFEAFGISGAWLAAGALAFSAAFWSQAIIIEVYALLACFFCLLLALSSFRNRLSAFSGGLLLGAAITHHLTALLWVPGFVVLWGIGHWRWRLGGLLIGLSAFLLLLPLSGHDPAADWGAVWASPGAFVAHISGAQYHGFVQPHAPRSSALLASLTGLAADVSLPLALLGVFGLLFWARRLPRLALATLLWAGALLTFTTLYTAEHTQAAYTLPLAALLALWAGLGFAVLGAGFALWAEHKIAWRFWRLGGSIMVQVALATILLLFLVLTHYSTLDISDDTAPAQFITATQRDLPAQALVLTAADEATFTLWYAQQVLGMGQGWWIVDYEMLPLAWYRAALTRLYPDLPPPQASYRQWIREAGFAEVPIAARTPLLPIGQRPMQQHGDWFVIAP